MDRRTAHRLRTSLRLLAVALAAVVLASCGDEAAGGPATGAAQPEMRVIPGAGLLSTEYPVHVDEDAGLTVILGTPDLATGRHRVGFVLTDGEGLIATPGVRVAAHGPGAPAPAFEGEATFFAFPFGTRGMYVIEVDFDRAGDWRLDIELPAPGGGVASTSLRFPVAEQTAAPDVGDDAPRSATRTLRDVASVAELSTGTAPDPAVYELTLEEAAGSGLPYVVVFASPAFCTSALCGPQVEMLSELHPEYGGRMHFIHVDLYENPHEIQGDLDRAVRAPVLEEWGIRTDEWTFVVDAEGRVAARFESFVTRDELEAAMREVLEAS